MPAPRVRKRHATATVPPGGIRCYDPLPGSPGLRRSDVDLLVTLPAGKTGLALGALLMDVQDLLGRRVDVVTEDALHPAFRTRVLKEARVL